MLGFVLGFPAAALEVYGSGRLRRAVVLAGAVPRGTLIVVILVYLFFVVQVSQNAFVTAVIGLGLRSGAYQSEYIRSAILSVDAGQLTAARAIGLSNLDGIRHVVLPQGLRSAIPGWSNELVYLIKYSSLAAFITVPKLYFRASDIASETFRYTAMFTLVALMYLAPVVSGSTFMTIVEALLAIPGLGHSRGR